MKLLANQKKPAITETRKNINISISSNLLNQIRIIALIKDVYAKDYIIQLLERGVEQEGKQMEWKIIRGNSNERV
jgi:hypothetical protein